VAQASKSHQYGFQGKLIGPIENKGTQEGILHYANLIFSLHPQHLPTAGRILAPTDQAKGGMAMAKTKRKTSDNIVR
jgi:hypothetical protein